jgi:hypothetical protein
MSCAFLLEDKLKPATFKAESVLSHGIFQDLMIRSRILKKVAVKLI